MIKSVRPKGISGSGLKLIAILSMVLDHIALHLLAYLPVGSLPLFSMMGYEVTLVAFLRGIGRLAFPIFSFLLVEGYLHTHQVKRYARNLFIFALISEIPWNLVFTNQWFYEKQNIFFTLLLGLLAIQIYDRLHTKQIVCWLTLGIYLLATNFLQTDFGYIGVGFPLLLYVLRQQPVLMSLCGILMLPSKWIGGLAFLPILCYNGERGFIRRPFAKYLCYAFYPVHLFVIYLIKRHLFPPIG